MRRAPLSRRRVARAACSTHDGVCPAVCRVTITPDTRVPNAATLVVEREDHTFGNMLRMCARLHARARERAQPEGASDSILAERRQLLENPEVTFGGYRVQHPLEPAIQVKVQTKSENPGPVQAVDSAITALDNELDTFERRFREAVASEQKKGTATGMGGFGDPMAIG